MQKINKKKQRKEDQENEIKCSNEQTSNYEGFQNNNQFIEERRHTQNTNEASGRNSLNKKFTGNGMAAQGLSIISQAVQLNQYSGGPKQDYVLNTINGQQQNGLNDSDSKQDSFQRSNQSGNHSRNHSKINVTTSLDYKETRQIEQIFRPNLNSFINAKDF